MKAIGGMIRLLTAAAVALVFAVLAIITLPVNPKGRVFHGVARTWARLTLWVGGIAVRVRGLEFLRPGTTYVYVSNHASLFDIPVILASIPDQIRIVYKKELERIPFFGWGLKWGSYVGIDRAKGPEAARSLEEAARKIREGASVLLYAEGTRTLDGRLQPFKRGAFNLAVNAGVPVVPLTVNGTFAIMPKGAWSIRPGQVELVLDKPIDIGSGRGKEAEMKLMDQVHAAIAENYVEQQG